MAGYVVHEGATVTCLHQGQAQPTVPSPRVKVSGQKVALQTTSYTIAGCTLPPPPNGNGPCATAEWTSGAARVRSQGVALVIQGSMATCVPSGTGLTVVATQIRVKAT